MESDRTILSWAEIAHEADRVAGRAPIEAEAVFGIPTGGSVVGALVAPIVRVPLVDEDEARALGPDRVLVVDDLVDSGKTIKPWVEDGYATDVLFRKPHSPGFKHATERSGWLVFPWEHDPAPTDAVTRLLEYIGEDPSREGLLETPRRVTQAYAELTTGYAQDPADYLSVTFTDDCDEMVVVDGIEFTSLCEHHLLPFTGRATIGYVPNGAVVGLSKLGRVVDVYARRLQVQERMTREIADAIATVIKPLGVGVVIEAHHSCMGIRGVRKSGAITKTSALLGLMREDPSARAEFLTLARANGSR